MMGAPAMATRARAKYHDPAEAGLLAIRRELARRRLIDFAEYVNPRYERTAAHEYIAAKLEQVERYIVTGGAEGIGRLMIFMPPRHGKTELSKLFQAWFLGRNPDLRVITTSYSADLANDNSKSVRDIVMSKNYSAVFGGLGTASPTRPPVEVSDDARSVSSWNLKAPHRGGMLAAGVGGGITGRGAHLLNIDDPFKNRDEAASDAHRKRVLSWYRSVAYTRLERGGAVVLINTRWDQEDLSGELLKHMVSDELGDAWEVVFLPAFALAADLYPQTEADFRENLLRGIYVPMGGDQLGRGEGEALWSNKYDTGRLKTIQANTLDYEFSAQYQQMPRLAVGEFLDDADFRIIDRAPEGLRWVRYVDLALGESETSDSNSTLAGAIDADGNLYFRDRIKERALERFLPLCKAAMVSDAERGVEWGFEDVAFQRVVFQQFMRDPELLQVKMRKVKPLGDKVERARPWQLRAKNGKVFLVRGTWNQSFIREAAAFPGGRHDDDVDSASGCVQMLSKGIVRKEARSYQG